MEQTGKKKKVILGVIAGAVAYIVAYIGVQQFFFKTDIESELKKAAIELNDKAPISVDEFTRLDSASVIGKTNIVYHYTLDNLQQTALIPDTINKYLTPVIIENVKNSPELKGFREHNITMDDRYYDENANFLTEISVTPELYKTE